jgi:hypothetical protein
MVKYNGSDIILREIAAMTSSVNIHAYAYEICHGVQSHKIPVIPDTLCKFTATAIQNALILINPTYSYSYCVNYLECTQQSL